MKNQKNENSKLLIIGLVLSSLLVVSLIIITIYQYINEPKKVKKENLDGGDIYLTYTDDVCGLTLANLGSFSDADGQAVDISDSYFDFSVSVSLEDAQKISYQILLVPDKNNTVDNQYVKAYLEKQTNGTFSKVLEPTFIKYDNNDKKLDSSTDSMLLYSDEKMKSSSDNYRLRLWVSNENEVSLTPEDIISYRIVVSGKAS